MLPESFEGVSVLSSTVVWINFSQHCPPLFRFGTRFPCMSDAYNRELRQLAQEVASELGYSDFLREGVYCVLGGPSFETIAECRMLHTLGADAVGGCQVLLPHSHICTCTLVRPFSNSPNIGLYSMY